MSKVFHLGTVVTAQFGISDDKGNVKPLDPVQIKLEALDPQGFAAVATHLEEQRANLQEQLDTQANAKAPNEDALPVSQ